MNAEVNSTRIKNPRILIVEDSDDDVELTLHELRRNGIYPIYERVMDGPNMRAQLNNKEWDIILCDFSMPGFDAMEALSILKKSGQDIPLIIVSGTIGEDLAVAALKHGANDYLLKDKLARLAPAVEHELRDAEVRRQRRQLERFASGQVEVLEMIIAARPLKAILEHIARRLEEMSSDDTLCSIHVANSDGTQLLHGAAPSLPDEYNEAVAPLPIQEGLGSSGTCAVTGKMVIVENTFTHPDWVFARDLVQKYNLKACWSVPVFSSENEVLGTVALYHRTSRRPSTEELRWAEAATHLVSITIERTRAIERLRASEAYIQSTFAAAPAGIAMTDVEGRYILTNPAYCRIVGRSEEELRGHGFFNLTHPEDRPEMLRLVRRLIEGEIPDFIIEKRFVKKDETIVWARASVTLVRGEDGAPRHLIAVTEDITEHRSLKQQFLRAQRMESIGTLAGGIAHDLNNILAPITMSVDLLRHRLKDDSCADLLEAIAGSARRGSDMIRQVLSFARGMEGRRMEVQVRHLINEVHKIIRDTFPKNIEIRTSVSSTLSTVIGDPTQLHQVLLNLCVNARDAMPDGGTIYLSAETRNITEEEAAKDLEANPGVHSIIEVRDNGTGIQATLIDKIFDPFFTTKEVGKGTGLGLSTSLAIIRSHGGFVQVESEGGQGTCFRIHLPASTEEFAEMKEAESDDLPMGNGESILVIDDEIAVREVTRDILETFGYKVTMAAHGAEGVRLFAKDPSRFHVVLLDMMMPVMDGSTVIKALAKIEPQAKIIAVSGIAANGLQARDLSETVKSFLAKPYSADTLLKAIRDTLAEVSPTRR